LYWVIATPNPYHPTTGYSSRLWYRELLLADLSKNSSGHVVTIRRLDGTITRHFVGELALREGQGATFTLDREKHKHPDHDVLILTAEYLLEILRFLAELEARLAALVEAVARLEQKLDQPGFGTTDC